MIDGERRGPFPLERLPEMGVHPSTYVWCKGMDDWEKAEDVADICRFYRNRLFDIMHPGLASPEGQQSADGLAGNGGWNQNGWNGNGGWNQNGNGKAEGNGEWGSGSRHRLGARHGIELPTLEEIDSREDMSVKPRSMLIPAIIATLFFCPPIGIFAIYFAIASKRCWKHSLSPKDTGTLGEQPRITIKINGHDPTASDWRRLAHDYARAAKMWSGIAFFIGIILYSFLIFRM